ncbi:MAG: Hsp20 family protein [Thermomicrobiales bacterium]
MSITTWSPLRELETLRERMDKLFAEMNGMPMLAFEPSSLALDVQETDEAVVVTASVPGFKPDDLTVEINKGVLTIRGESKAEREEKKGAWRLQERRFGSVQRAITLPAAVYDDEAKATLADGVLTVTIPKSDRTPTRRIDIEKQ